MRSTTSRLGFALALGLLAGGCAPDSTLPSTPAVSFDRGGLRTPNQAIDAGLQKLNETAKAGG